jgi:hypothetical protein
LQAPIGWNNRTKDGWTMCRIGQSDGEACSACLIEGSHARPVLKGKEFKLQPTNRFLLCCYEELVGIAGFKWRNGNTSTVRNLEVRQLAPMPN